MIMRKHVRIIALLLALLMLTLTACKGGEEVPDADETTAQTDGGSIEETLTLVKDGVAQYYIIFDTEFESVAQYINSTVQQKTGAKMKEVKFENKDWTEHKIYVGSDYDTVCPNAEEKLTFLGYAVVIVGEDIHICGYSTDTVQTAADKFLKSIPNENISENADGKKTLVVPTSLAFVYNPEYVISNPTLLSKHVSDYQIVYGKDEYTTQLIANELRDYIGKWTGFDVPVVSDAVAARENEILIGKTNRAEYVETAISEYSFKAVGSKVQISGSYISLPESIGDFKALFGADTVDLAKTTNVKSAVSKGDGEIRVMSSNVGIPNKQVIELTDTQRGKLFGECYLMLKPDFVGLQEGVDPLQAIKEEVSEVYGIVEQSGEGTLGVRCPILYLKSEWKIATDDQEQEIKGWYKFSNLHCYEWVMFERIDDSTERFIMFNLHYPTTGTAEMNNARTPAAQATNAKLKELMSLYPDVPITVTGDYNSHRENNTDIFPYMFEGLDGKMDIAQSFTEDKTLGSTTHSMGTPVVGGGTPIDHISVTNELLEIVRHRTVAYNAMGLSGDHFPVFIDVKIKTAS